MLRNLALLLVGAAAFAADDPWIKVKELKSGTEIRIVKKGGGSPLVGKLDEARDENLTVVLKNEQVTIEKDSIERLDYRPLKPAGRVTTETKSKTDAPDPTPPKGMNHGANVPGASSSTTVSFGSKPDFEVLYRRPPQKK
jgi:hypothetical protein